MDKRCSGTHTRSNNYKRCRRQQPDARLRRRTCQTKQFDSVGLGVDIRLESNDRVGSALIHDEQVVHLCLFASEDDAVDTGMASMRRQRRFRRHE